MKFRPQVSKEHYFRGYDTKERWMSYWYQINEVLNTKPRKVLEVGIGNKTVSNYLKERGIKVTTVDIDPMLNPDYVCSVTELTKIFKPEAFDTVLCAEVLEHLPFKFFGIGLNELYSVSKKHVILSLPFAGINIGLTLKLPKIEKKDFTARIPVPLKPKFDGQHYWEIGRKGIPLKKIEKMINKKFLIIKRFSPPEDPLGCYFVLLKIDKTI